MKNLTRSALVALITVAAISIAVPSWAAPAEVHPDQGVSFVWLAGTGDFDGAANESSNSYVFVDFRINKYIGVEGGYIALGGPNNEGLHLGLTHIYEANDKLDLTAHLGHGFTDEPEGGLPDNWMTYGAGLIYDLDKHFGLRARWQRLDGEGDLYWAGFHWHLSGFQRSRR